MPGGKLFFLRISTIVCNHLAYITAGIHYCMVSVGFLKAPVYVLNTPGRKYKNLHNIWYARILRRMVSVLVRSPLRSNTLQLVNFTIPLPTNSGCINCHLRYAVEKITSTMVHQKRFSILYILW